MALERYTWDAELFLGITVDAMLSGVWQTVIAVDDVDLNVGRSTTALTRSWHVRDVMKGLTSLPHVPVFEPGLDVDLWRCRVCGELDYVANLCALPEAQLHDWRG